MSNFYLMYIRENILYINTTPYFELGCICKKKILGKISPYIRKGEIYYNETETISDSKISTSIDLLNNSYVFLLK